MPQTDRKTLREYFEDGRLPTQEDFYDLIDSTWNVLDDGLEKTDDAGIKVNQYADGDRLISFMRAREEVWHVHCDSQGSLLFTDSHTDRSEAERTARDLLCLARGQDGVGRVGIGTDTPEATLDVAGVVRAEGRLGAPTTQNGEVLRVPADGEWHRITGELLGCHAFEVTAGVGGQPRSGRFALMHAVAMNTYNPTVRWLSFLDRRKQIPCHHAYHVRRRDKLKLRWRAYGSTGKSKRDEPYWLELKSASDYGAGADPPVQVQYYITRLWFDPHMDHCRPGSQAPPLAP